MSAKKPFIQDFSSKIKKVYIELHDYSFFHSPTSTNKIDPRFIGRDGLIAKLKSLLQNTDTKSGAYLITGYKGMGKSSFVNKVLYDIGIQEPRTFFTSPLMRLLIGIILFNLLYPLFQNFQMWIAEFSFYQAFYSLMPELVQSWSTEICLLLICEILLLIYLTYSSRYFLNIERNLLQEHRVKVFTLFKSPDNIEPYRLNLSQSLILFFKGGLITFRKGFLLIRGDSPDSRFRASAKIIYQVILVFLIAALFSQIDSLLFRLLEGLSSLEKNIIICLPIFSIAHFFNIYARWKPKNIENNKPKKKADGLTLSSIAFEIIHFSKFLRRCFVQGPGYIRRGFVRMIDRYRRICIRISLGYNDLKEIDVLRIVARSLHLKYDLFRWDYFPAGFIRFIVLIVLTWLIYSSLQLNNLNDSIETNTTFGNYFPTQLSDTWKKYNVNTVTASDLWKEVKEKPIGHDDLKTVQYITVHGDWLVLKCYDWLRNNTPFFRHIFSRFLPNFPVYFFVFYLLITFLVLNFISRRKLFGIVTHRHIRRQLKELNELLNSQVVLENRRTMGVNRGLNGLAPEQFMPGARFNWGVSRNKTRSFMVADEREIEKRLIEILEQIDQIPPLLLRPEFIFIFDELDKVEPYQNYNIFDKQQETTDEEENEILHTIDTPRGRQHRILKILSNLKHFLNTAKAKFLFIAGREMYDAALADVSDRNYFIGSIFHSVIYVESFLKDASDERHSDVTSLIEEYVCHYILPKEYHLMGKNLNTFKHYLTNRSQEKISYETMQTFDELIGAIKKYRDKFAEGAESEKQISDLKNIKIKIKEIINNEKLLEGFLTKNSGKDQIKKKSIEKKLSKNFKKHLVKTLENIEKILAKDDEIIAFNDDSLLELEILLEIAKKERQEREHIIALLRRLINYLAYRSNGAPKKLTQFFENYIVKKDCEELVDLKLNRTGTVIGNSSHNLYLQFEENDQYILGLTNYLITPFMLVINNAIKDYGDKLLISTSFILDHLFKYHKAGFSWRNLELMPEIIDINKAPQLRNMIQDVIEYLSNTYINLIISGLFDFRFSKKIVEELSFVSKISERQSAVFNFTLDESLTSKRHYSKQIQIHENKYKSIRGANDPSNEYYIHSLGFYYMILGDLHYADEEFDDAIVAYQEALQFLRHIDIDNATYAELITYIRNMLKLGLAYERKKTYDSALIAYGLVTQKVTEFIENFNNPKIVKKHKMFFPEAILEGIRLMYQPFIAKLELIEKANLGGVTERDLERIKTKFDMLTEPIKPDNERYLIAGEFYNKIGDILFYKNGASFQLIPKDSNIDYPEKSNIADDENKIYCWQKDSVCSQNIHRYSTAKKGLRAPCRACEYYMKGLNGLRKDFLGFSEPCNGREKTHFIQDVMEGVARRHHAGKLTDKTHTSLLAMANTLSDVGDTFLSCATRKETIGPDFWELLFTMTGSDKSSTKNAALRETLNARRINEKADSGPSRPLSKLEEALLCYYAAGVYFARAGEHQSYGYQLTKMLYVIRDHISILGYNAFVDYVPLKYLRWTNSGQTIIKKEFIARLKKSIVLKAVKGFYRAFKNAHRLEVSRYREIFVSDEEPEFDAKNVDLNSVSQVVDIRELLVAFYEIEVKLNRTETFRISRKSISAYAGWNSVYNRIVELRYKSMLCEKIFRHYYLDLFRKTWETYYKGRALEAFQSYFLKDDSDFSINDKRSRIKSLLLVCHDLKTIYIRKMPPYGRRGLQWDNIDPFDYFNDKMFMKLYGSDKAESQLDKALKEIVAKNQIEDFLKSVDNFYEKDVELLEKLIGKLYRIANELKEIISTVDKTQSPDIKERLKEIDRKVRNSIINLKECYENPQKQIDSVNDQDLGKNQPHDEDFESILSEIELKKEDFVKLSSADFDEINNLTELLRDELAARFKYFKTKKDKYKKWGYFLKGNLGEKNWVEYFWRDLDFTTLFNDLEKIEQVDKDKEIDKKSSFFEDKINELKNVKQELINLDKAIKSNFKNPELVKKFEKDSIKRYVCSKVERLLNTAKLKASNDLNEAIDNENENSRCQNEIKLTAVDRGFLFAFIEEIGEKREININVLMEFLITDAIYCLYRLINYCQVYGVSHMNTHSLLGSSYAKMATWASRYDAYRQYYRSVKGDEDSHEYIKSIDNRLSKLLAEDEQQTLRYSYNSEMALHHYRAAKELHNEGKTYRTQLEKMFYLNDDFNDNRYHFSAAIERYWLNTDVIDERLDKLKKVLDNSSLYDLENFDK